MSGNLRKIIFLVILLGVSYVGYAFMIRPANKHLTEQKLQVENKLQKFQELEEAADSELSEVDEAETESDVTESTPPPPPPPPESDETEEERRRRARRLFFGD